MSKIEKEYKKIINNIELGLGVDETKEIIVEQTNEIFEKFFKDNFSFEVEKVENGYNVKPTNEFTAYVMSQVWEGKDIEPNIENPFNKLRSLEFSKYFSDVKVGDKVVHKGLGEGEVLEVYPLGWIGKKDEMMVVFEQVCTDRVKRKRFEYFDFDGKSELFGTEQTLFYKFDGKGVLK